ncbi:glycolipid transfer protein-like [Pyrus ussuriensis x Pyrus communis]|uniref:Glycolipid transfer protein-like n=1 Tax=Pyrus ussuriensis x Pyrus communis TaxID=2448454 RepID=A0A5N5G200_9ROSA|nr:glycolipid transfer protein-like [Pyrus ussuriensis x Pyrus communis]
MARVEKRKDERILTRLADEFEQLAAQLNSPAPFTMEIGNFTQACRLVSPLIRYLGVAMKFADIEYSAKISGIEKAGKSVNTLEDLLDSEIQQNTIKHQSSASRFLIRVKRSLEMLKIIFEQIMASSEISIMDAVNTAYKQVFYPYHGWAIRKAVGGALLTVPTRSLFFIKLKVDEASAFVQMQRTIIALAHLIHYIDNLFHSRESAQELLSLI